MKKTCKLKFYKGTLGTPKDNVSIIDRLAKKTIKIGEVISMVGVDETFRFHSIDDNFVYGEIRKHRSDLPGITDSKTDKDLSLKKGESLFEFNQFLICKNRNILIYQINVTGCALSRFGKALGLYLGNETAVFVPVVDERVMEALLVKNPAVKSFSCSVAIPDNLDIYKDYDPLMNLDNVIDGVGQINYKMSLGRGKKGFISNLFSNSHFKDTMKLDLSSARITDIDGKDVDLLESQISESASFERNERLEGMRTKIKRGLTAAYTARIDEINSMFNE